MALARTPDTVGSPPPTPPSWAHSSPGRDAEEDEEAWESGQERMLRSGSPGNGALSSVKNISCPRSLRSCTPTFRAQCDSVRYSSSSLSHTHTVTHRSCPVGNGTRVSRRLESTPVAASCVFQQAQRVRALRKTSKPPSPPPHPLLTQNSDSLSLCLSLSPFLRVSNTRAFTPYVDPECDLRATSSD